MKNKDAVLKFRFTESSLSFLTEVGVNPKQYLPADSFGIQLRNFGEEITILGKTKYIAFGEENQPIPLGIKLVVPEGYYATFLEDSNILNTSLAVRQVAYGPGTTDEITVSFFNFGEREVVIPKFATLPVHLVAKPFCKNSEVVSDLEYLESAPAPKSPGVDN